MAFTISCSQGHIAEHHDKRDYYPNNADKDLQQDNKVIITTEDYNTGFRKLFQNSVDEYNSTQKRADRKKKDYLDEIANGDGKEHPFYEYVLQIGNRETNGVLDSSPDALTARDALDAAAEKIQDKYPSFHFWFIGSHGDEPNGTYHYHLCFTPVGTGYKNGMQTRCSLTKALENMGFTGNKKPYPIDQWKTDVEKLVEDEMKQRGLEREYKNEHRKRLEVDDFRREQMVKDAEELLGKTQELNEEAQREWDKAFRINKNLKEKEKELTERESDIIDREQTVIIQKGELNRLQTALFDQKRALQEKDRELTEKAKKIENKANYVDKMFDEVNDIINQQTKRLETLNAASEEMEKQRKRQKSNQMKQERFRETISLAEEMEKKLGRNTDGFSL